MEKRIISIRAKLTLAFGGLALLLLIASSLSLTALSDSNQRFTTYLSGAAVRVDLAHRIREAVDQRAIAARNLVLVKTAADLGIERAAVMSAHEKVQEYMTQLRRMADAADVSAQAKMKILAIAEVEEKYGPVALEIVRLALENKTELAITKMNDECRPLLNTLLEATNDYGAESKKQLDIQSGQSQQRYEQQRNYLLAACALAFLGAALAGYLIARSLSLSLGAEPANLNLAAQKVAAGDLSAVAGCERAPAGSVLASLGAMQASLAAIVGQVRGTSELIASGSAEIADGNADLRQRTEHQASSLIETAASMEQINGTARHNSDNAAAANELASHASEVATQGGMVVGEVINTMREIQKDSREIADIVGVIDSIAFQTNILALNAAVEAARAGEQGRGFAVVAAEVRILAKRSADAAKLIKTLIHSSVGRVERGSQMAAKAGSSMQDIVDAIKSVNRIAEEIAFASKEQMNGVGQVSIAIAEIDGVTQRNVALVEASADSARNLRQQAAALVTSVSLFRVCAGATC